MKKTFLKNIISTGQRGISLLQMMVIGAVVTAAGGMTLKMTSSQRQLNAMNLKQLQVISVVKNIELELSSRATCLESLSGFGNLTEGTKFTSGIKNVAGNLVFKMRDQDRNQVTNTQYVIDEMVLTNYTASPGVNRQNSQLSLKLSPENLSASEVSKESSYHLNYFIPISITTNDNDLTSCQAIEFGFAATRAYSSACTELGGTYNVVSDECEGIENWFRSTTILNLCAAKGSDSCVHPYNGKNCSGTDLRGANWNNWVVNGFNSGSLNCVCIPKSCPASSSQCYGVDLGTDHCAQDCGVGSNTGPACCQWSPSPSLTCVGQNVTQTNSCTGASRSVGGTKTTGSCAACTPATGPPANTICIGSTATGPDTCGGNYSVAGTKTTGSCASCTPNTGPAANTICSGTTATGSDNCGGNYNVPGSKTTGSCASCTPATGPPANTICSGTTATGPDNCGGNYNVPGSKTTGSCAKCTVSYPRRWKERFGLNRFHHCKAINGPRTISVGNSVTIPASGTCYVTIGASSGGVGSPSNSWIKLGCDSNGNTTYDGSSCQCSGGGN